MQPTILPKKRDAKIKLYYSYMKTLRPCSFVIPITENTGELYFDDGTEGDSILYDSMVVLNTKKPHGVRSPSKERIVFHMGIHDVEFEKLK